MLGLSISSMCTGLLSMCALPLEALRVSTVRVLPSSWFQDIFFGGCRLDPFQLQVALNNLSSHFGAVLGAQNPKILTKEMNKTHWTSGETSKPQEGSAHTESCCISNSSFTPSHKSLKITPKKHTSTHTHTYRNEY